jgi:hypothetical protein
LLKFVNGEEFLGEMISLPNRRSNLYRVLFSGESPQYVSSEDVVEFMENYHNKVSSYGRKGTDDDEK